MHRAETTEPCTIRRRNQDGSRVDVPCPPLLPDYQQYMRGVDRGDQLVGFYNVGRRSRKWWKRCFSYLLECSLLNAYVLHSLAYPHLHQATGRQKFDFLKFRLEVATQLINSFSSRQRSPNQTSNNDRLNIHLGHWPILVEDKRDCIVCKDTSNRWNLPRKEGRHQTRNKCSYCNVYLCIDKDRDCFTKYHTLMHYTL